MNKLLIYILSIALNCEIYAQSAQLQILDGNDKPIESVQLINAKQKTIAISDKSGRMEVPGIETSTYTLKKMGFQDQSIALQLGKNQFKLKTTTTKSVEIKGDKHQQKISTAVEVIDRCELGKLACCNLAESFENSNTVDVNYSDGVTGGREIQMLGLAGTYSQQLLEGTPYQRGILNKIGLELVPGPWLDAIAINKGIGSVINGYDNISGQINLEYMKPKKSLDWFINGYISEIAKSDFNVIKGFKLSDHVYSSVLAHSSFSRMTMDNNNDGFTDMPRFTNFNLMNRWQYFADNGFVMNAALQATQYEAEAGQILEHSAHGSHKGPRPYVINQKSTSYQAMVKTGWELDAVNETSIAVMYRFNHALQSGNIDTKTIDNTETFFNVSPIYQTNLDNQYKLKIGAQLLHDRVDERIGGNSFSKNEWVPGAFSELTFKKDATSIIAGLRGDYHNTLGLFVSPRLSLQFTPSEAHVLKLSSGLGFRTPTYLSESFNFLISNRQLILPQSLEAEKGWNSGISYKYNYELFGAKSTFEASYFLTLFQNQFILNVENPDFLKLEYIRNNSRAQSFQIDNDMKLNKNWSLRLSYKNDQTTVLYDSIQKQLPLLKNDKFLANLYWVSTNDKWRVSTTLLINGAARIPKFGSSAESYSPTYPIVHTQLNFVPSKKVDIYIGSENIFSYAQQDRIRFFNDTENKSFDASMIWGPLDVRRMYIGGKFSF